MDAKVMIIIDRAKTIDYIAVKYGHDYVIIVKCN